MSEDDESDIISIPPPPGRLISKHFFLLLDVMQLLFIELEFCESPPEVASSDSSQYRSRQADGEKAKRAAIPTPMEHNR